MHLVKLDLEMGRRPQSRIQLATLSGNLDLAADLTSLRCRDPHPRGGYEATANKGCVVHRVEWHTGDPKMLPVLDHYGLEAFLSIERQADRLQ